ncbi:hypothetical protein H6F43_03560 [Leptolyngbya sp. FACHB-36]|uniref:hypothetical protein n=1 Tax=Leptolyngbya sp. FACHB-36 TaxID=2692808 RepID=UPI00168113D0|nr:hypothetical protein [Leptolyngbya sp. FACHB-36]MBD2019259.1 hypothetical protein [Leptolyngbya sp. FACHB-36]
MFRQIAIVTLAAASVLPAFSAFAAPFKDMDGNIHIQDVTPNAQVPIEAGESKKKVKANYCGLVVVSKPNTSTPIPGSIVVGGETIDTTTLPMQSLPACVDNALKEARATNFKTSDGRVVLVAKTAGINYDVIYTGVPSVKQYRASVCGFVRISNSLTNPAPASFTYASTPYTTADLPTQTPGRCINGVKFIPQ